MPERYKNKGVIRLTSRNPMFMCKSISASSMVPYSLWKRKCYMTGNVKVKFTFNIQGALDWAPELLNCSGL